MAVGLDQIDFDVSLKAFLKHLKAILCADDVPLKAVVYV